MSLPSTRTRRSAIAVVPLRSACSWKSAASEYGSSPDEQPALHTLITGSGSAHERGNHALAQHGVRLPVPEQLRDVDRQRVEQLVVLGVIVVEHACVLGVRVHAPRAHAHRDAAAQALVLVARAAEAAIGGDLHGQRREGGVGEIGGAITGPVAPRRGSCARSRSPGRARAPAPSSAPPRRAPAA